MMHARCAWHWTIIYLHVHAGDRRINRKSPPPEMHDSPLFTTFLACFLVTSFLLPRLSGFYIRLRMDILSQSYYSVYPIIVLRTYDDEYVSRKKIAQKQAIKKPQNTSSHTRTSFKFPLVSLSSATLRVTHTVLLPFLEYSFFYLFCQLIIEHDSFDIPLKIRRSPLTKSPTAIGRSRESK